MLGDFLETLDPRDSVGPLVKLFRTPWPNGLSKEGALLHPKQSVAEYTLVTHYTQIDKRKYVTWIRDAKTLKMPEKPLEVQY
jgi:hypothetical protein